MKKQEEFKKIPESRSDLFETLGPSHPEFPAIAGDQIDIIPVDIPVDRPVDRPVDEAFRFGEVGALLTQEQKEKTEMYVDAISKAFDMSKADLGLVVEEAPEGARRVVLIDTSLKGQYMGSYISIQMNRKGWINVGGQEVNVLAGTTDAAYRAMIKDAKKRRVNYGPLAIWPTTIRMMIHDVKSRRDNYEPLPNSGLSCTMLTGEPLTKDGYVQLRGVDHSRITSYTTRTDRDSSDIFVRPAMVIAELIS